MTTAYCPSTLRMMRDLARRGANVEELARRLGWHPSTVDRVCARHGIEVSGGDPDADCRPALVPEPRFRPTTDTPKPPRSHASAPGTHDRLPIDELRTHTLTICVSRKVAAAVRAKAKERNVTISLVCAEMLKAAVECVP